MGNAKSILRQHGYIPLEEIEQGAFGKTLRVKKEKDGKEYIIKGLHKSDSVMHEVTALQGLKHPFIVQYLEHFEDEMNVYIVMEYCEGGDLSKQTEKQKDTGEYFPEDQILAWFVEICLAVEYVHEKKILHRDIKPENIFLDKNGWIRLGDFGLAKPLERSSGYARTVVGTFCYRSPERIEEEPYSSKSDIWALGCVLYELCELKHAFPEENLQKLFNKIVDGPYPSISGPFSTDLRDLVRDLLQKNPVDRPSASDILERPFLLGILIQRIKGIPEKLLQKLKELDGVADGLERVHFGTTVGSLTGGVIGAAGGIATIVGVSLAPVTLGASLIVTGVGIGVAAAGGVTGAASNVTKMVNEHTDRRTIENIIHECEAKMQILVTCLQSIDKGFEHLDQSRTLNVAGATRVVRSIGGLAKLAPAVQAFNAASQAVRLAQAAEVVTGVFAGLFLALDIYFIVDDSREIHAMRQQGSNNYTKMEEESEEPPDEASAGPQAGSAEGQKALKTREFIKKIREVSAVLQKWLEGLESVYSIITELEEAYMSF
ncbi:probable serine/threonine-protein kinase nek2 [Anguilla anguilla]|uniref:probable serine/threonine-protein kinase nek2 n=1 Tax=Anguilla anguilla TaxID=7936 RepID=UPI0015B3316D|nr:probable serine/threonine-protein kinase nek2 [Anguilla anguilla]XP_035280419.1 probable serine/threonine-protein kinase nek2 [Anguilla anguilla]XP_035280420.1 probable serine/threonine-protein kinase nek2 [Anguilla anguilla]XP_035280421.1 probable serine/threonine-protein kinase nek2 [Anguilla anguilla]